MAPWLDPRSRRPLVLLVVVCLGVLLAPLALDVARAFYTSLPRWFRWSIGQASVLALIAIGLRRLWRVRPTDAWPAPSPHGECSGTRADRWIPWGLRLGVASLVIPIMEHPDGLGFADWDFVLDKFEALRRTIIEWGQFPWWNPWCRGGFPLAAEPQIGAVSIATPLILAFGTTIGLRLATVLCLGIAVEGAYRLAWIWTREPWSAAPAALVYGLNGAVLINSAWGYVIPMSYCSLPWLAYHAFRIADRPVHGPMLGFWMAFVIMNGIQYLSLYAALLTGLIWLRALRLQTPGGRALLLGRTAVAVGTFLALCGWRLATVVPVILDDARGWASYWDVSPLAAIHHLLYRPPRDWSSRIPVQHLATFIETTAYVGPIVVLLAAATLARGWRWWHTLALVAGWLALGSSHWYQPSAWLADWPAFASTHVVTRWRFVAILGLGLAAADELAYRYRSGNRVVRLSASLLVVALAADYGTMAYQQLPLAFSVRPESKLFPGPPVPDIVNVRQGLGYPCVLRGYGVIEGYEPMLGGYRRDAPSLRRARGDTDYRGEAWTDSGPIQPSYWSPNRIVFRAEPGQMIFINQNPGSWWLVNGDPTFAGLRCAEALVPFASRADADGNLELRIRPEGLGVGIALHIAGLALVAVPPLVRRAFGLRRGIAGASPTPELRSIV